MDHDLVGQGRRHDAPTCLRPPPSPLSLSLALGDRDRPGHDEVDTRSSEGVMRRVVIGRTRSTLRRSTTSGAAHRTGRWPRVRVPACDRVLRASIRWGSHGFALCWVAVERWRADGIERSIGSVGALGQGSLEVSEEVTEVGVLVERERPDLLVSALAVERKVLRRADLLDGVDVGPGKPLVGVPGEGSPVEDLRGGQATYAELFLVGDADDGRTVDRRAVLRSRMLRRERSTSAEVAGVRSRVRARRRRPRRSAREARRCRVRSGRGEGSA